MNLKIQLAAVDREIAMRRVVYGKRVAGGQMKQDKADAEIAAMVAVKATLLAAADMLSRMEEPGCAGHTLGAFLHGTGVANLRTALGQDAAHG